MNVMLLCCVYRGKLLSLMFQIQVHVQYPGHFIRVWIKVQFSTGLRFSSLWQWKSSFALSVVGFGGVWCVKPQFQKSSQRSVTT